MGNATVVTLAGDRRKYVFLAIFLVRRVNQKGYSRLLCSRAMVRTSILWEGGGKMLAHHIKTSSMVMVN